MGDLRDGEERATAGQFAPAQQTLPAGADIAGFWRRLVALWIDMALLACVGIAIGLLARALGKETREFPQCVLTQ